MADTSQDLDSSSASVSQAKISRKRRNHSASRQGQIRRKSARLSSSDPQETMSTCQGKSRRDSCDDADSDVPLSDAELRRLVAKACSSQALTAKTAKEVTERFDAAIEQSKKACMDEIASVKEELNTKVSRLGDDIEALKQASLNSSAHSEKVLGNIEKDMTEWRQCRRTAMITPVEFSESEDADTLVQKVRLFLSERMKITNDELNRLGPFSASRPLSTRFPRHESPVQVVFDKVEDRDFCFGRTRVLSEKKGANGRLFAKFPRFLQAKRQALEAEANKIRREGRYWAQVRFSDGQDLITIYVKDPKGGPWLRKEIAFMESQAPRDHPIA